MTGEEVKRCPRCGKDKPATSYYGRRQGGLSGWCRTCTIAKALESNVHVRAHQELDAPPRNQWRWIEAQAVTTRHRLITGMKTAHPKRRRVLNVRSHLGRVGILLEDHSEPFWFAPDECLPVA